MSVQGVMNKLKQNLWQGSGPNYERVDHLEDGFEKDHTTNTRRSSRHTRPVIIVLGSLLAIFLFLSSGGHESAKSIISSKETLLPPAYLRMLLPVRYADANYCKTVLSTAILNYPEPMLIGFAGKKEDKEKNENADSTLDLAQRISRKTSILGIDKHLRNISTTFDEDLVVIADGLNTWFQLRPQTLLDRYFESNRNADERLRKELGVNADVLSIRQRIIFGAQRDCSPWNAEDPACAAVPESTLPNDIYGPQTDAEAGEGKDPFTKQRPRYINSGFAMGPVKEMRKLYAEAAKRIMGDQHLQDEGKVLGQLFAEQEMARESYKTPSASLGSWLSSFWESATAVADRQAQQLRETDLSREYGIGLDYASGLAFEAAHADGDMEFVRFGDAASVHAANAKHGISDSRISQIAPDVGASLPPFWTFSKEILPARNTSWTNVSLLTNAWTGVTPAIIQHDMHNYRSGSQRETWWSHMWYQKYARKLFDVHVQMPIGPVAISGYDASSRRQWWGDEDWKGGARNETKYWWRYEDVCTGTETEVFRDNKGPWYLPNNH